jgi:hypothetical protein
MKVSLNYTGRVKLEESEVSARLIKSAEECSVVVSWDFSERDVTNSSGINIEVYGAGQEKRFEIQPPIEAKGNSIISIAEFRDTNALKVRIKVVSRNSENNLPYIKFVADDISVENESDVDRIKSILPILKRQDLDTPWYLELDSDEAEGPCLIIRENDGLGDLMLNNPLFVPFVLPGVVSRIFEWVYEERDVYPDTETWAAWKDYFVRLGVTVPSEFETMPQYERQETINGLARQVSEYFSVQNKLVDVTKRALGELDD